jgi:hypothetical protein
MVDRFESGLSGPEELAGHGLRWLLRGGTWQALARELAWAAVQSTGAEHATLEWLTPLVEARLAERVDGLEFQVDMAATAARLEHVRAWPHDLDGADTAAVLEGYDEAVDQLSRLYLEELEWSVALIAERLAGGRSRRRPSSPQARRNRPATDFEVPRGVAERLSGGRERFGWPRRRAA